MRRFSKFLVAVSAGVAFLLVGSAASANHSMISMVAEAGGTANLGSGIKLDGSPSASNWTFSGLILNGVFDGGSQRFAGSVTVGPGLTGYGVNCGADGYGTIGTQTAPGTFTGSNQTGTISGSFYGSFVRSGAKVDATLHLTATINGHAFQQTTAYLDVTLFAPTGADLEEGALTQATFLGEVHTGPNAPAPNPNPSC